MQRVADIIIRCEMRRFKDEAPVEQRFARKRVFVHEGYLPLVRIAASSQALAGILHVDLLRPFSTAFTEAISTDTLTDLETDYLPTSVFKMG